MVEMSQIISFSTMYLFFVVNDKNVYIYLFIYLFVYLFIQTLFYLDKYSKFIYKNVVAKNSAC